MVEAIERFIRIWEEYLTFFIKIINKVNYLM